MLRRALLLSLVLVVILASVGCAPLGRFSLWRNRLPFNTEAFMNSVRAGNLEQVKQYLEAGMQTDTQDQNGYTPIIVAAEANQPELVDYFLSLGRGLLSLARCTGRPAQQGRMDGAPPCSLVWQLRDGQAAA
ncbi:MAG: hypothetical protein DDT38_01233 [Firmicutes bacterium]|nr:hypothetical protein [candidate division NPL-UPA2 bacterium]